MCPFPAASPRTARELDRGCRHHPRTRAEAARCGWLLLPCGIGELLLSTRHATAPRLPSEARLFFRISFSQLTPLVRRFHLRHLSSLLPCVGGRPAGVLSHLRACAAGRSARSAAASSGLRGVRRSLLRETPPVSCTHVRAETCAPRAPRRQHGCSTPPRTLSARATCVVQQPAPGG